MGWRNAIEVPGSGALNKAGNAVVNSLSCPSAGNCSAGGSYEDSSHHSQAFVVNEVGGAWKPAIEVPGSGALNKRGNAGVYTLSCPSAGNCSAGGSYEDSSHHSQAFVVNEVGGAWKPAIEVPGSGALNKAGSALVDWLSCASAGNCSAGGSYEDSYGRYQAFVDNEVGGTWKPATEVPGSAALNKAGIAGIISLSCASAGNCSAGGDYGVGSGRSQAFVDNEVGGTWKPATEVPGSAALNKEKVAALISLSCPSPGNCSAGGDYKDGSGRSQAFVDNEVGGTWKPAIEVPGSAALNKAGNAQVYALSCSSAGDCSAAGSYNVSSHHSQVFVVNEVGGTWRPAVEVPGSAALNKGGFAQVITISCASAGDCSAGGSYKDGLGHSQAFVVNEVGGTWRPAVEVPGSAALNKGGLARVYSLSCPLAGDCSAGGFYDDGSGHSQAFVANES